MPKWIVTFKRLRVEVGEMEVDAADPVAAVKLATKVHEEAEDDDCLEWVDSKISGDGAVPVGVILLGAFDKE